MHAQRTDIILVLGEELIHPGCHKRCAVTTMKSDSRIHHCFSSDIHSVFAIILLSLCVCLSPPSSLSASFVH